MYRTLLLVWAAASLEAGTIWFTDRTSWLNATTNAQTIDFEGHAPATYTTPAGVTIGAVRFTSPQTSYSCPFDLQNPQPCSTTNYHEVRIQNDPAGAAPLSGAYLTTPNRFSSFFGPFGGSNYGTLVLEFAGGTTAAGWDFEARGTMTASLSNGASSFAAAATGFLGFASTDSISRVDLPVPGIFLPMSGGSGYLRIDNVSNGNAVPEPGTWALTAGGLLLAAGGVRRRAR